jgi:hypothetical protein
MINHLDLPKGTSSQLLSELILEYAILDTENMIDNPGSYKWHSVLSSELQQELIGILVDTSIPDKDFYAKLTLTTELAINPRFSGESWNCANCQKRKLDRSRNCPYLDKEEFHDPSYALNILGEVYTQCPMNLQDYSLLKMAFDARSIRQAGNGMPEAGGLADQSVFYVICSEFVERAIKSEENRQQSEAYNKRKT